MIPEEIEMATVNDKKSMQKLMIMERSRLLLLKKVDGNPEIATALDNIE